MTLLSLECSESVFGMRVYLPRLEEILNSRALLFSTIFFNPQQMFLLRVKLITQGENGKHNETMLRDKLRVFVSRISLPLVVRRLASDPFAHQASKNVT